MKIEQEDMFPEVSEETVLPEKEKVVLTELEILEEEMDRCPQCDIGYCGKHTDTHRRLVGTRN